MATLLTDGTRPERVVVRVDEQAVDYTRTDAAIFSAIAVENLGLSKELTDGRLGDEAGLSAAFDGFLSLYRNNVTLTEFGNPLQRLAVEALRDADEFESLREYTVADEFAAYLQTCATLPKIVASIPDDVADAAKELDEAKNDAEEAEARLDQSVNDGADADEIEDAEASLARAKARLAQAEAEFGEITDKPSTASKIKAAANKAVKSAVEKAERDESFAAACGSGSGTPGVDDPEVAKTLAKAAATHRQFDRFCELFGRLSSEITVRQLTKTRHDAGSAVDVTLGADLCLADEFDLAEMLDPDLATLAELRYFDESLQQLEVEDLADAGKGDLYILVDVSGSMDSGSYAATPTGSTTASYATQAKALAIAIAQSMTRARRHATIALFDDDDAKFAFGPVRIGPEDVHATENGVSKALSKIVSIAGFTSGGGTSFEYPIAYCVDSIRKADRGKADVLIITDGDGRLTTPTIDAMNELRRVKGVRFYSIFTGSSSQPVPALVSLSDRTWKSEAIFGGTSSEVISELV